MNFSQSILFVVFVGLLAMGHAQLQILQPGWSLYPQATLTNVGHLVDRVPTAVSHQSSTIVHRTAPRITPLYTPTLRTAYLQYPSWSYPLYNGLSTLYRK
ncbi:hypothetical protein KR018_000658 [Drosophila ironensis]|nr:hypothetical protein KR018_000658 [Drosophila ironensis]